MGYLLSPSWRLMVQPVSHAALGPEDNPLHCVSAASLPQLNNNTINCNSFRFSENDTFHLWDEMWTVILCCCYIKLFTIPNIRNDLSGNLLKLISPWLPCLPRVRNETVTWSLALENKVTLVHLLGFMASAAALSGRWVGLCRGGTPRDIICLGPCFSGHPWPRW